MLKLERLVAKSIKTRSSFGFGKDEVTRVYKVVKLRASNLSFIVEDCNVLDLETGEWRHVSIVPYRIFSTERSVYMNGSVHWFTVDLWEPNASRIVAFDLHIEEFRVVSHPNFSSDSPHLSELLSLRNRLSVSDMKTVPDVRLDIWSMVDVAEERWAKTHSICLCLHYQRQLSTLRLFTPLAISEQEDGVVIIWDYKKTFFKCYPNMFPMDKVSVDARVVATSYF